MKNIEKYMKEILGFASSVNDRMAVRKTTRKPCECSDESLRCEECMRYVEGCCDDETLYKWAMVEYVELKISKTDRVFLDYLRDYKYIARDLEGRICAYTSKPTKYLERWGGTACKNIGRLSIDFPMVKWSDDEPWKIEDLKELEVVDEYE